DVSLLREDWICHLSGLQSKRLFFEDGIKLAPLVLTQVATRRRGGSLAETSCQLAEVSPCTQATLNVISLCLGFGKFLFVSRLRSGRNQDLAQLHTFRLRVFLFVRLKIPLNFTRSWRNLPAHLVAHHFLGNDLVADIRL